MRISIFALMLVTLTGMSYTSDRDIGYDDRSLRVVDSFDLQGHGRHDPRVQPDVGGSFSNQFILERILSRPTSAMIFRKSYFNGTAEAKAYALLGLAFIKSPVYAALKADFLQYSGKIDVYTRIPGLTRNESPAAIVAAIDSGRLLKWIIPRANND